MTLRMGSVLATVLLATVAGTANAGAQLSQSELARQLLEGDRARGLMFADMAMAIEPENVSPELRAALITALEREGRFEEQRRRGEVGFRAGAELIARLAMAVAPLRDPQSIPALAGALGASPPAAAALADFGEPAARAILDVMARPENDGSVLMDALGCLVRMTKNRGVRPLSDATLDSFRGVAKQRLSERQRSVVTLWLAIDLAVALNDPDLVRIVESLASDRDAVRARGVTDPELIETTQRRARQQLLIS